MRNLIKLLVLSSIYLVSSSASFAEVRSKVSSIRAHGTDIYYVRFYRGYRAKVAVAGAGATNLDMYIYDKYGNLACYDSSYTDRFVCRWYPRTTGTYRIVVKNRGHYRNRYAIATNY